MERLKFITTLHGLQYSTDAYIVGGTVRDILIGKEPVDIDIVVSSNAERFAKDLFKNVGGVLFLLDKKRGVFRIAIGDRTPPFCYDISPMKGGDILSDLSFRDFTIDAAAVNLSDINNIIDPYNGKEDIERRCIRAISEKSFDDDPLRLLRAFRLSSTLKFEIDRETFDTIREKSSSIRLVARERIRDEFFRLISSPDSIQYLKDLYRSGLLIQILTGLNETDIIKGLSVFEKLEQLYNNLQDLFSPDHITIEKYLQGKVEEGITCAMLWKWISLYIVNDITEELMWGALQGLRLSNRACRLAFLGFRQRQTRILDKAIKDNKYLYHFFKITGDDGIGLILYKLASTTAAGESYDKALRNARSAISWYLSQYREMKISPFITGDDLIALFHLTPGPEFRQLLDRVEENRATGLLLTKEDAISFLKKQLTNI